MSLQAKPAVPMDTSGHAVIALHNCRRALLTPVMLACTLFLGGCAAQTAYKEGRDLAAQGHKPEALVKFEEAVRLEPTVAQHQIAASQIREAMILEALGIAHKAMAAARYEQARQAFNQVLLLHPENTRAQEGLRMLDSLARHDKWSANAQTALNKNEPQEAQNWLRMIVAENPANRKAQDLLKSISEDNSKPTAVNLLAETYRKPITIEFKDAALKTVFEVISRTSGLNFLFDKDVKTDQKTSIFLKNSTIESAVNLTLLTNQLEQRVIDSNTVLIYPNTQAKQKDYQALTVKSFYLANAEAKTVAATIKTILKTRDVVVDDKLNMLIVRDTPESIRLAEKLVALHDVAEPEVMLEVEVLEVKRTRLMNLGIQWPDQLTLSPLPVTSGGVLTVADLRGLTRNTLAATVGSIAVNAKKLDTDANILANPRIRARNREKAKILIGERVPNITTTSTATGFLSESVSYVDVGLKLDVEPTIYLDGEVAIKISLEVSSIISQIQTKSGSIAYEIGTRTAQTVLRLKDGENQVLAGLINDEERRTGNKVPGLGDVPLAGRLFGSQLDDNSKTEIVLSITPRILRNVQRPDASILEFDSGTESSVGGRGSSSPVSGGQAPQGAPAAPPAGSRPVGMVTPVNPGASASGPSSSSVAQASTDPASSTAQTAAASGTAQLQWQGPTLLKTGDSFALQLLMQSEQPVVSIPLAIGFDAKALQVVSVVEGDFLKQGGGQSSFTSRVDPNGQVLVTGTRSSDGGGTTLGGVVTLNFRSIGAAPATTRIQLLTIAPIAAGGRALSAPLPLPQAISIAP